MYHLVLIKIYVYMNKESSSEATFGLTVGCTTIALNNVVPTLQQIPLSATGFPVAESIGAGRRKSNRSLILRSLKALSQILFR